MFFHSAPEGSRTPPPPILPQPGCARPRKGQHYLAGSAGPSISDDPVYLSQSRTSPRSAVGTKPRLNQPDGLDSAVRSSAATQLRSSSTLGPPRRAAARRSGSVKGRGGRNREREGKGAGRALPPPPSF